MARRVTSVVVCILSCLIAVGAAAQAWVKPAAFEPDPVFAAADLVPSTLLVGPHHQVASEVPTTGYLHQFHIDSEYGAFDAEGRALLAVRLHEIEALAELAQTTRGEEFIKAMANAAAGPYRTAVAFVSHPVKTITGIPGGVGRLFKRVAHTGSRVAKSTTKDTKRGDAKSGDQTGARSEVEDTGASLIGLNSAKRKLAEELGVDPYSRNAILQTELDRVAWARTAGGLVVRFAVPGIAVVGYISDVEKLVWNLSPAELAILNAEAMQTMGVDKATQEQLFDNANFTPTLLTELVHALATAPPNAGQQQVAALAASVDSEAAARFVTESAAMLADYHQQVAPIGSWLVTDVLIGGVVTADRLVVALPVDYLTWTEDIAAAIGAETLQRSSKSIRLAGDVSTVAAQEIVARGWHLTANTRLNATPATE